MNTQFSSHIMALLHVQWFRRIWVRLIPDIFDAATDPQFRFSRKLQPHVLCCSCTEHMRSLEVYLFEACKP
jgi:hypothetical protein